MRISVTVHCLFVRAWLVGLFYPESIRHLRLWRQYGRERSSAEKRLVVVCSWDQTNRTYFNSLITPRYSFWTIHEIWNRYLKNILGLIFIIRIWYPSNCLCWGNDKLFEVKSDISFILGSYGVGMLWIKSLQELSRASTWKTLYFTKLLNCSLRPLSSRGSIRDAALFVRRNCLRHKYQYVNRPRLLC